MRNAQQWRPSKFVFRKGKLRASNKSSDLQVSSRLVANIVASHYQQYLPIFAKGTLIDLGCGKAPLYEFYKDYVECVTCVDWQHSVHENPFTDQTCDLNGRLPFDDSSYDTILLSDVLEHIAEPENLWLEMTRILKSGGVLILNVPFLYKIHEMPFDYFRYTEFSLRRFAERSQLNIVLLKGMGGLPEVITDLVAKLLYKIPVLGSILAIVVQAMCGALLRTGLGKKMSEKTIVQYPMGYFMVCRKGEERNSAAPLRV